MSRASISTVLVRPLARALEATPPLLDRFFAASDLTPQILADSEARVSPAQFCVAWSEATRLTQDSALALSIAQATPRGAFGIVEYVCRSAPTLGQALEQWCRYLSILDDAADVGLVETGGFGALRLLRESEAPAPASHELCFALVVKHARASLAQGCRVVEVRFSHQVDNNVQVRYRDYFEAPVRFGASQTELVFDRAMLEAPLTTADPDLHEILRRSADSASERSSAEPLFTDLVRRAVTTALSSNQAQVDTVAKRLGMTGRSLQRRLKDEGTSFQALRDTLRRELADRYLGQELSVAEISFLLGFSEPSAFFRAFKRWTGITPLQRRASLAEPGG